MTRTYSDALAAHQDEPVRLQGWLLHQRRLANVSFVLLRDARGIAQVVVSDTAERERVSEYMPETVIEVRGRVVASEQATSGFEIHDPEIAVISAVTEQTPFELRRKEINAQLPTVLDNAAVALRHPAKRAAFRLSAAAMQGFRSTLDSRGFTEIATPKIVAAATESGANVFAIDYFGRPAYLAQSPQFYKQKMVGVFEQVYEIAPVFRAEPHDTVRHLAQYVSMDAEMGFIESHRDVMAVLSDVIAGMVTTSQEMASTALELLGVDLPVVPDEIPVVHFRTAQEMIEAATGESVVGEPDLAPAHERWLGEWAKTEHGSDFVFVEGYPMAKRPFYTYPDPDRPEFSQSFDLLFRGLELVTGGQRLHAYSDYLAALDGEVPEGFEGYLDAFKFGMPPHGGFAIGLERWVARLTGAQNVREVTLFPRDLNRLTP